MTPCPILRLLAAVAAAVFAITAAHAQKPPPPIAGRWNVSYVDSILGSVTGTAKISKDETSVEVSLTDPLNGTVNKLQSESLSRSGDKVTIKLKGRSPAAAGYQIPAFGQPVPLPGESITVELNGSSKEFAVAARQQAELEVVTLELTITDSDHMNGSWSYVSDAVTGRDGQGGGRVGDFQFKYDGSGTARQSGDESWARPKPEILAAIPVVDQMAMAGDRPAYPYPFRSPSDDLAVPSPVDSQRIILVIGKDLPRDRDDPSVISSLDPQVTYYPPELAKDIANSDIDQQRVRKGKDKLRLALPPEKQAEIDKDEVMLLDARLQGGVKPGQKGFTLNGTESSWLLQFGDQTGRIDVVRSVEQGKFEPTDFVFRPERVYLEIHTDHDYPWPEIPLLLGHSGKIVKFGDERTVKASQVAPRLYRTGPIDIVDPRNGTSAGGNVMPMERGEVLTAELAELGLISLRPLQAQAKLFVTPAEIGTSITQPPPGIAPVLSNARSLLWRDALMRAASCANRPIDDWDKLSFEQQTEISNVLIFNTGTRKLIDPSYPIWQALRVLNVVQSDPIGKIFDSSSTISTSVLVGDHAAMLMLRSAFVELMAAAEQQFAAIVSDEKIKGFRTQFAGFAFRPENPLARVEVTAPDGSKVQLWRTYMPELIESEYHLTGQAAEDWKKRATLEALRSFRDAIHASLLEAQAAKDCDVEELLRLTGYGFETVVRELRPRLMKLGQSGTQVQWSADAIARSWIDKLASVADQVRAQKDLSAADTKLFMAAASVAAMPAMIIENAALAAMAIAYDLVDFGYNAGQEVVSQYESHQEIKFARGAAAVIGLNRLREAEAKDEPWFIAAANILGTGLLTGSNAYTSWLTISEQQAVKRGRQLVAKVSPAELAGLSEGEQHDLMAAIRHDRTLLKIVESLEVLEAAEQATVKLSQAIEQMAERPEWAAAIPQASYKRIEDMGRRADVHTFIQQNPSRITEIIGDDVALDVLRGSPFENMGQLEDEIAKARQRVARGGPEFYAQAKAGSELDGVVIKGDEQPPAHGSVQLRLFAGTEEPVGEYSRSLMTMEDGKKRLVLFSSGLERPPPAATPELLADPWYQDLVRRTELRNGGKFAPDWLKTPVLLTPKGTPTNMYMNMRAMNALGIRYADATLSEVKISSIVNANSMVQLRWLEKTYLQAGDAAQQLDRIAKYLKYTNSYKYTESLLDQAGFRIKGARLVWNSGEEAAGKAVNGLWYDNRITPTAFLKRYGIAADEPTKTFFEIILAVEPARS